MLLLEVYWSKIWIWIKSSLRLNWMSYIRRIHKMTSTDKRTEWKLHLESILNQIHLKIGQEAKKNCEISNLSRNLKIWIGCLQAWIWKSKHWWIDLKHYEHDTHIWYLFLYSLHEDWLRRKSVLSWILSASALQIQTIAVLVKKFFDWLNGIQMSWNLYSS